MNLILKDGTELPVVKVDGAKVYYQNADRDSLAIYLEREGSSLDELDSLFSNPEKTETLKLVTPDGTYIHSDYVLKISSKVESTRTEVGDSNTPEVLKDYVIITLAQRSYLEKSVQLVDPRITQLEAEKTALESENVSNMLAMAEMFENTLKLQDENNSTMRAVVEMYEMVVVLVNGDSDTEGEA